ncbi:MAG: short-chain dehydrogenase, partial [Clostridiales bacterium]|nr:short-chain dehydrogenase [Clostridiales bacterium]
AARELTIDGHEKTLQVNHLAGFLLTMLLMEPLIAGNAAVINTSSVAHRVMSRFDIDDLELEKRYSPSIAYGNAKLMNILFARELNRRFGEKGISAAAFHPGIVATGFAGGSTSPLRLLYRRPLRRLLSLATPREGADTLVWLATGRPGVDWQPGGYYVRRRPAATSRAARDGALAERLWVDSERMVAQFL